MMNSLLAQLDMGRLVTQLVEFVPKLIAALFVLATFAVIYRLTRGALEGLLRRADLHATLVRMLVYNVYRIALTVLALVMAADQVGINVGAALAGIGVVGLAIGFAAQDSIANIISGFLIFLDKPFEVGDWVSVAEQYGQVNDITMRSTRIRTRQNTYVVIPNKTIIDVVLVNHSKHGSTRVDVPIGVAYKENIARVREVLLGVIYSVEGVLKTPSADLVVTDLGASSVNLKIRVWIGDAGMEQPVYFGVVEACKLALDEAHIQIPFPHMQLFIENVEEPVWKSLARLRSSAGSSGGVAQSI